MLTLVDTSVWIDHFRNDSIVLRRLLGEDGILCHPLVIGELACGTMKHRSEVLDSLAALPSAPTVEHEEM